MRVSEFPFCASSVLCALCGWFYTRRWRGCASRCVSVISRGAGSLFVYGVSVTNKDGNMGHK